MDCPLEREIRLSEETEKKSLYPWSLQEFNDDGNKIGGGQVPCDCSLTFTTSELRHNRDESITAILHPGICIDGKSSQDDTTFSMFGTARTLSHFNMNCKSSKDLGHNV